MAKLVSLQIDKHHYNVHHVAIEVIKSLIEQTLSILLSTLLITLGFKLVSFKCCITFLIFVIYKPIERTEEMIRKESLQ